ncbi:hypothetical protein BsIDN1_57780 [Bacillus safensis]|uniref:3-hydroxyacyl-CoA dehydrogenase C-terminal domain-containing protein n=1 Tax=Bacillus safensis TaxID=561879 RepID=A0A5S9MF86_BACIA|nr:hypothetical protein BsIDN1_57780 [Bacillus safensis]
MTLTYGERTKLKKDPGIEMAKQQKKGAKAKLKALIYQDGGRAGQLLWNMTAPVLLYSAHLKGEIADDIQSIDNAMKWGFGWQHGPFELWDAIGVKKKAAERMEAEGRIIPAWVQDMLSKGHETFYQENADGVRAFYHNGGL